MFVERLKKLLSEREITKNKLLTDLQLGKNSFVNWESRGTIPSGEVLTKIAEYFGVTVDYLLGNTDSREKPKEKTPSEEGEKDGKDVVVVFRGGERIVQHVTPEQAALIDNLLKQFDAKHGNT